LGEDEKRHEEVQFTGENIKPDWTNRNYIKQWESIIGLRQRDLYQEPLPEEQRIC
jgi:hypothetical protein